MKKRKQAKATRPRAKDVQPAVSVLMPSFNSARFIGEAIASIRRQTLKNWELLVLDGGSTDGTLNIVRALAKQDKRIRLLVEKKHTGLTARANAGLRLARAPLLARMDSDDISDPRRLEKQVAFLAAHPAVGIVGTARTDIDERGSKLRTHRLPLNNAALQRLLYFRTPFFHPTVMARKALLLGVGGYDEKREVAEDYDLWARVAGKTEFANLPEPLLFYRKHGGNLSMEKLSAAIEAHYEIGERIEKQRPIPPHWKMWKRLRWLFHHTIGQWRMRRRWENEEREF